MESRFFAPANSIVIVSEAKSWTKEPGHDVSSEPRASDGEWIAGGGGESSSDPKQQTKTEAFHRWFGESKCVEPTGHPTTTHHCSIVYHGTDAVFQKFDPKKAQVGTFGKGFYFTENKELAESYIRTAKTGHLISAYLSVQKPFDLDQKIPVKECSRIIDTAVANGCLRPGQEAGLRATIEGKKAVAGAEFHLALRLASKSKDTTKTLTKAGYDGVVLHSTDYALPKVSAGEKVKPHDRLWVAFRPTQIKSSTDNEGTFDPKNPDITKGLKEAGHDVSDEPRDDHGEWTQGGGTAVAEREPGPKASRLADSMQRMCKSAAKILDYDEHGVIGKDWEREKFTNFLSAATTAAKSFSEAVAERIDKNLESLTPYDRGIRLGNDNVASGLYRDGYKSIEIDAHDTAEKTRSILIHEMTHALDRNREFSADPEWIKAWREEIYRPESEPGTYPAKPIVPPLTQYATTSACEGFAEFGRALFSHPDPWSHTGGYLEMHNQNEIASRFPKCLKFWEDHGLLDKKPEKSARTKAPITEQFMPDIFDHPVVGDGYVGDALLKDET